MTVHPADRSGDRFALSTGSALYRPPRDRPLRMRGVEESDLPALARLDQEVFQRDAYPFFVLRQLFDVHPEDFLVLDDGETLRGYVLVGSAPEAGSSWILGLGVTPDRRGRGHGRRLMVEILRRLRTTAGIREVRLTVEPTNAPAIVLYRSLGFSPEGAVRKGYFGPDEDRLIMTLSL
ncbi:GNAT family N-acetyltransferase [Streptomyces sp. NPDC058274]|uniref:GNAT family N-acetyltransferase n=1 Tax=Streptomyces sp. NPDC058274 TaxID=3346416 RepID=UPI0036E77931